MFQRKLIQVAILTTFLGVLALGVFLSNLTHHLQLFLNMMAILCIAFGMWMRNTANWVKTGWLDADPPGDPVTYEAAWPNGPLPHMHFNRITGLVLYASALFAFLNPLNLYNAVGGPNIDALTTPWTQVLQKQSYRFSEVPQEVQTERMCREAVKQRYWFLEHCAPRVVSCEVIEQAWKQGAKLGPALRNKVLDQCIDRSALTSIQYALLRSP